MTPLRETEYQCVIDEYIFHAVLMLKKKRKDTFSVRLIVFRNVLNRLMTSNDAMQLDDKENKMGRLTIIGYHQSQTEGNSTYPIHHQYIIYLIDHCSSIR